MSDTASIQEIYWPDGICFGCGPANDKGLHIRSFPSDGLVVARWRPEPHHQAFAGVLNGGIIGTLLDCHSAATAWWTLSDGGAERGPNMVTAEYSIELLRPTPVPAELRIVAQPVEVKGRRVVVAGRIEHEGEITATSQGTFVRPKNPF